MKNMFFAILMSAGVAALGTACGGGGNNNDLCPDDPAKLDPGACGCGIADVDFDGNGSLDCFEGTISLTWTLVEGDNNTIAACPAGYETIAVVSENPLGEQYTDLFDCTAGGGVTSPLPIDNYLVWVQLTDNNGATLYAQSLSTDAPVVGLSDTALDFEFSLDRGAFYLSWETWLNGSPSDCETVGGFSVSVLSTDVVDPNTFYEDLFDCTSYSGTTAGIAVYPPEDTLYTESISLLDENDLALLVADAIDTSLDYGNHYRDLGVIVFDYVP